MMIINGTRKKDIWESHKDTLEVNKRLKYNKLNDTYF